MRFARSHEYIDKNNAKIILASDTNAKLLNFT